VHRAVDVRVAREHDECRVGALFGNHRIAICRRGYIRTVDVGRHE
jgi:hypothetical protein